MIDYSKQFSELIESVGEVIVPSMENEFKKFGMYYNTSFQNAVRSDPYNLQEDESFNPLNMGFASATWNIPSAGTKVGVLSIPSIWDLLLRRYRVETDRDRDYTLSIPSIWDLLLRLSEGLRETRYAFRLSIPSIWDLLLRQGPKSQVF